MPALVDDLSEKSRRDLGAGVTRNLQVVAEAATGAVQRWIQLSDEATARIMKREEHIEWLRKLFTGWKEARPALRESRRRREMQATQERADSLWDERGPRRRLKREGAETVGSERSG